MIQEGGMVSKILSWHKIGESLLLLMAWYKKHNFSNTLATCIDQFREKVSQTPRYL